MFGLHWKTLERCPPGCGPNADSSAGMARGRCDNGVVPNSSPDPAGSYSATWGSNEVFMFLTLFAVLLVLWLLGFLAFHIAGGLIHLLLIVAVISLVLHLFRRA
jgi:hypothetical protein